MHTRVKLLAAAAVAAIPVLPAVSHHSNSAYQVDQIVTLEGTVKEWQWVNPHTWLYLAVEGEGGRREVRHRAGENGDAAALRRDELQGGPGQHGQ